MDELTFNRELNSTKRGGSLIERVARTERKLDYLIALVELQAQRTEQVTSAREHWLEAHRRRKAG